MTDFESVHTISCDIEGRRLRCDIRTDFGDHEDVSVAGIRSKRSGGLRDSVLNGEVTLFPGNNDANRRATRDDFFLDPNLKDCSWEGGNVGGILTCQ